MNVASRNVSRPRPVPTPYSAAFWNGARDRTLIIQRCDRCARFQHPPGPTCRSCGGDDLTPTQVSGKGTLHSFTTVHYVFHPAFSGDVPYIVARVAIAEQDDVFLFTNLRNCEPDAAYSGMPVEVVFETVDDDVLPQFQPAAPGRDQAKRA